MERESMEKIAFRVSWVTIVGNVILSAFKLIAGIMGQSAAMVSDAVHSASDVISTVIVMIGVKLSGRKSDEAHPYGYERFECVAAILLAILLCATGFGIAYGGIQRIIAGDYGDLAIPGMLPLVAAIISIVVKEAMYWYTRGAAIQIDSGALMADAWHHRSDALSSIGSFVGILGARMGYPALDSVACIVISAFIVKASYDIFRDAVGKMTDKACDEETTERIRSVIARQAGVQDVDVLRTRLFGNRIYVDVEIRVERHTPLYQSHEISARVHTAVEENFEKVKHCMVHVNPSQRMGEGLEK